MSSQELVDLIGHLAWPVTVLVVLIALRRDLRAVLGAIKTRVADPQTPVRITREGVELSARVDIIEGNLEVERLRSNAIALAAGDMGPSGGPFDGQISARMRKLHAEYLDVRGGDRREKVRRKNAIADELGAAVLRDGVAKTLLADEQDEIWTLALSASITAVPEFCDDQLLLLCAKQVRRLHVRYRVAAAFSQLAQSSLISPALRDDVLALLDAYREGADPALIRRLDRTSSQLTTGDDPRG